MRPIRASATREKLNILVYLTQKGSPVLTYCDLYSENCAIFCSFRSHQKWLCYFVLHSHGKLDLIFFLMGGLKSVWICCTYQWPKSLRKVILP